MNARLVTLLAIAIGTLCASPNEWTNVGPGGGPIRSLVIDPQNPATIYAATSVGVFKSKDAGASWSNAGLIGLDVAGLVVRTGSPSTLFAWTQGSNLYFFKSADAGATWNEVSALPERCCFTVAFDAQDANTIFALTPVSLFKSSDGGTNWTQTPGLPNNFKFFALSADPHTSGALYAGALGSDNAGHQTNEVFKSTDGGASWQEANSGLPAQGMFPDTFAYGNAFTFDPNNSTTVYVSRTGTGVYKSTNGGGNWRPANSGMPSTFDFRSCCVSAVIIDPQNANTLYVPSQNGVIFKSTNGGASWSAAGAVLAPSLTLQPQPGSNVLVIDPQNTSTLYAATHTGVLKSTDGGTSWNVVNSGLRDTPVSAVAINPQVPSFIYAGNLLSTDAGNTWFELGAGKIFGVVALAMDQQTPGTLYAATSDSDCSGSIFKSIDGGITWRDIQDNFNCLSTILSDPQNPSALYAGSSDGMLHKTVDGGLSWSVVALSNQPINTLAIDRMNTNIVYAGARGVFKSIDGGSSWSTVDSALTKLSVNSLAIDPQNTTTLYAATSAGLFKSVDAAASWQALSSFLSGNVYAVVVNPQDPRTIYVGSDAGVTQSTDGGVSGALVPDGPDRVRLMLFNPQDPNTLYAGGPGGLFAITFAAPVLFSLSGDGKGQGAVWRAATGEIATANNPAGAGEVLSMYAGSLVEDSPMPHQVTVGGLLADILFFGDAPGYPGFSQINFRVPGGISPAPAVLVRLTDFGRSSNEITIGIQ